MIAHLHDGGPACLSDICITGFDLLEKGGSRTSTSQEDTGYVTLGMDGLEVQIADISA
jgi:hypothetical protein